MKDIFKIIRPVSNLFSFFFFLISILIFFSQNTFCQEQLFHKAEEKKIESSAQWLKLLKYRQSILSSSSYKSQAVPDSFFLSDQGRKDPKEELLKAIEIFFIRPSNEAICRFPARYLYLAKMLEVNISKEDLLSKCTELSHFYQKVGAKSASLIFSSYFISNPASAFGHSFLRFGKGVEKREGESYDLLDYAVNFGAAVNTNNALLYSIYGTLGLFKGHFLIMPYFYKIREYNDHESRDLWSYQLNFTQEEVDLLVFHSWEMGQTYFAYYYFDENCSYYILSLIDAIKPEWNLIDRLKIAVIPIDTIKVLFEIPNSITKIEYRPSLEKKFQKKVQQLKPQEINYLSQYISKEEMPKEVKTLTDLSQSKIYDAAIDYLDKTYSKEILLEDNNHYKMKKNELLSVRSKIDSAPLEEDFSKEKLSSPHLSHGSQRLSLSLGHHNKYHSFSVLGFRNAFHEVLEDTEGFPPKMTLIMGDYKLRLYQGNKLQENKFLSWKKSGIELEEVSIFKILSINPFQKFTKRPSFNVHLGSERIKSGIFERNYKFFLNLDAGLSLSCLEDRMFFYTFIDSEIAYMSDHSQAPILLGLGPELGLYTYSKIGFRYHMAIKQMYFFLKNKESLFKLSNDFRQSLVKNNEINLNISQFGIKNYKREMALTYLHFF